MMRPTTIPSASTSSPRRSAGSAVSCHCPAGCKAASGCHLAGDDAEAVVLDFMQPRLARGGRVSFGREAGGDEAGRKRTQHGANIDALRENASRARRKRAVHSVIGSGGADVHMRGDGRDCPMRVDAPEAGSCTPMIGEGLRAVCLQRVDEGRARAKRLRESGFTKMARSPGRHSPLGPRGITGPVGVGLGCHSPAARAGVLAR